jgi:hypothetical protein
MAQAFFNKAAQLGFLKLFNIEHGDVRHDSPQRVNFFGLNLNPFARLYQQKIVTVWCAGVPHGAS